jgi:hypothetical protein
VTAEGELEVVVTTGEGVAGAERAASREEDAEAALALGAACGRCCTPCTVCTFSRRQTGTDTAKHSKVSTCTHKRLQEFSFVWA